MSQAEISLLSELGGEAFEFVKANTTESGIFEEADMLFVDTYHTYSQCARELRLHGNKARKYIVLHDRHTFGTTGEDGVLGLLKAVDEFLSENPHWINVYQVDRNNGLTVLQRQP